MRREPLLKYIAGFTACSALFLVLTGCQTMDRVIKPDPADFTNVVFDTGFEETWKAIESVTMSEALPININDKEQGIIETQKVLEFNRKKLFRQYISLYSEVKRLSQNFTSVSVSYYITRYDPITHKWRPVRGVSREKRFLNKVKAVLEAG